MTTAPRPAASCSPIHAAMRRSHGHRSSSVSGVPAAIFARFASGWRSSPSWKAQPVRSTSACATEVFPTPDTPITTRVRGAGPRAASDMSAAWRRRHGRVEREAGHLAIGSNMCSNMSHAMERAAGPGRRRRRRAGPPGPARPPAHRTRAGVRRNDVPRGRGEVGAEPRPGRLAGALPLDREPLPGLRARLRLLPRRGDARAAGRRPLPPDRRPAARRRRGGHRGGRRRSPPVRGHGGPRALVDAQTRAPGHPRGRHHARRQRRPPLPDRPRMAARGARDGAGPGAAAGCAGATSCSARVRCPLLGSTRPRTARATCTASSAPTRRGGCRCTTAGSTTPSRPSGWSSKRSAGPTTCSPPRRGGPITLVRRSLRGSHVLRLRARRAGAPRRRLVRVGAAGARTGGSASGGSRGG